MAIFKKESLVDFSSTDFTDLKADSLIERITGLLEKNNIKKSELEKISYSENPGSQTGLKIGAAIARGLSLSLNIGVTRKDLFECILKIFEHQKPTERIIILPDNRQVLVWKHFNSEGVCKNSGREKLERIIEDIVKVNNNSDKKIYISYDLLDEELKKRLSKGKTEIVDIGLNFSFYIGSN